MSNTPVKIIVNTIIVIFLLTRLSALVGAQEAGGPRVIVQTLPDIPVAGSLWTLTFLVNHPWPEEVFITPPPFTGLILVDQVSKTPRIVNPATGQAFAGRTAAEEQELTASGFYERWTAIEYRFRPQNPGTAAMNSFVITTPRGSAETAAIAIRVQRAPERNEVLRPRLAWDGLPASLRVGQTVVVGLRVSGWNSPSPLPGPETFMPPIPPGVILESVPLSPLEQAAGLALKLRLIPLDAQTLNFARRTVSHENAVFEIPALRILVNPAAVASAATATASAATTATAAATATAAEAEDGMAAIPFPSLEAAVAENPSLFKKFRNDCERVYAEAKSQWEQGHRAAALAELRRGERDHSASPLFAALRKEAEQRLGLDNTKDEERTLAPLWRKRGGSGIMMESAVRRIPDPAGGEVAYFKEGQPVRLLPGERRTGGGTAGQRGAWIRITSYDNDEVSGWAPEANIIFY